ncbi:MAG: hypothetical protein J6Z49_04915 [Kiritimatiellae bacterium]|nr:hypothetical protein [Kiritimatiellia bacterium]
MATLSVWLTGLVSRQTDGYPVNVLVIGKEDSDSNMMSCTKNEHKFANANRILRLTAFSLQITDIVYTNNTSAAYEHRADGGGTIFYWVLIDWRNFILRPSSVTLSCRT